MRRSLRPELALAALLAGCASSRPAEVVHTDAQRFGAWVPVARPARGQVRWRIDTDRGELEVDAAGMRWLGDERADDFDRHDHQALFFVRGLGLVAVDEDHVLRHARGPLAPFTGAAPLPPWVSLSSLSTSPAGLLVIGRGQTLLAREGVALRPLGRLLGSPARSVRIDERGHGLALFVPGGTAETHDFGASFSLVAADESRKLLLARSARLPGPADLRDEPALVDALDRGIASVDATGATWLQVTTEQDGPAYTVHAGPLGAPLGRTPHPPLACSAYSPPVVARCREKLAVACDATVTILSPSAPATVALPSTAQSLAWHGDRLLIVGADDGRPWARSLDPGDPSRTLAPLDVKVATRPTDSLRLLTACDDPSLAPWLLVRGWDTTQGVTLERGAFVPRGFAVPNQAHLFGIDPHGALTFLYPDGHELRKLSASGSSRSIQLSFSARPARASALSRKAPSLLLAVDGRAFETNDGAETFEQVEAPPPLSGTAPTSLVCGLERCDLEGILARVGGRGRPSSEPPRQPEHAEPEPPPFSCAIDASKAVDVSRVAMRGYPFAPLFNRALASALMHDERDREIGVRHLSLGPSLEASSPPLPAMVTGSLRPTWSHPGPPLARAFSGDKRAGALVLDGFDGASRTTPFDTALPWRSRRTLALGDRSWAGLREGGTLLDVVHADGTVEIIRTPAGASHEELFPNTVGLFEKAPWGGVLFAHIDPGPDDDLRTLTLTKVTADGAVHSRRHLVEAPVEAQGWALRRTGSGVSLLSFETIEPGVVTLVARPITEGLALGSPEGPSQLSIPVGGYPTPPPCNRDIAAHDIVLAAATARSVKAGQLARDARSPRVLQWLLVDAQGVCLSRLTLSPRPATLPIRTRSLAVLLPDGRGVTSDTIDEGHYPTAIYPITCSMTASRSLAPR